MSKTTFSVTLVIIAALSLLLGLELSGGSSLVSADRGASVRAPKTAVVDIQAITNDYLRTSGGLDNLRESEGQERNLLAILRNEIEAQKTNLDIYPPESQNYLKAQTAIAIKTAEYKVRSQAAELKSNRQKGKLTAEIYQKAVHVITEYAQEKNIDMVFLKQDGDLKRLSMEEVSSNILVRAVIYSHPDLDITAEIERRMK